MKKIKNLFLILMVLFVLSPFITNCLNNNQINIEEKSHGIDIKTHFNNLKASHSWEIFNSIHITGANWSETADNYDWCSGSGTLNDPYIIENITIDEGSSGSGILIENSTAHFRIENCTIYNSGSKINIMSSYLDAGIKLVNVSNGVLINNTLSFNNRNGIYLEYSENNTILGNKCNDNNQFGIWLWNSDNNTISGNTANKNNYGFSLIGNHNNLSGNTANKNNYGFSLIGNYNNLSGNIANNNTNGISLSFSNSSSVTGNTAFNNIYGIHLIYTNNSIVSANILIGNVIFIDDHQGINNIIIDNTCYTKILPTGINEFEIDPYGIYDIDVFLRIALKNQTEVIFSAFNNNILDDPLDDGLIFINLDLNNTNNLNQSIKAPINITIRCDFSKYEKIEALWFNKSANSEQGAWEEIPFIKIGNDEIIISINHTSIFALSGKLKVIPTPDNRENDVNGANDIDIIFIIILAILICSLIIITASSTRYFKPRNETKIKPTKKEMLMKKPLLKSIAEKEIKSANLKDYVKKNNLLRILNKEKALENPILFHDLKFNAISNECWEQIEKLELNENDFKDFINDMLSLTPEERQEIIDGMLKLGELGSSLSDQQEYF
ncbi:MAG: nitrous oxide reductase family maturation protein NosD [Promethearchaeota archaeon]